MGSRWLVQSSMVASTRVLLGTCIEEPLLLEDKSMHTLVVTLVPLHVAILMLSKTVLLTYVCMPVRTLYVYMHACIRVGMHACMNACMHVCIHAYTYAHRDTSRWIAILWFYVSCRCYHVAETKIYTSIHARTHTDVNNSHTSTRYTSVYVCICSSSALYVCTDAMQRDADNAVAEKLNDKHHRSRLLT